MIKFAAIILAISVPMAAMGQIKIYLLPEVTLSKNVVTLGDIAKIDGLEPSKSSELILLKDMYKDSMVDRQEINDFLSEKLSENYSVFGNGVKIEFNLPEKKIIEPDKVLLIKKGQSVDLVVRKGPIVIELTGKALKNGYENEDVEIRVKNGRVVKGKAVREGRVSAEL